MIDQDLTDIIFEIVSDFSRSWPVKLSSSCQFSTGAYLIVPRGKMNAAYFYGASTKGTTVKKEFHF